MHSRLDYEDYENIFNLLKIFCLADVIDRLNSLRGNGMAAFYSWSCKRLVQILKMILTCDFLVIYECNYCFLRANSFKFCDIGVTRMDLYGTIWRRMITFTQRMAKSMF